VTSRPPWYAGASEDAIAHTLHAAGVAPTPDAILAALRAPRAPDLDVEQARGYLAACERWGAPLGLGAEILEGEGAPETMRPRRTGI
jgi:hypothetical protein